MGSSKTECRLLDSTISFLIEVLYDDASSSSATKSTEKGKRDSSMASLILRINPVE